MRPGTRNERGFYYVEVLASMAILGFVLISTTTMLVTAGRANAAARDQTVATTLAHDRAEELKRRHYATLDNGADRIQVRSMVFDRTWVVENDVPYPHMRQVTVTVTPRRSSGMGGNRVASIRFHRVPA
jgi:type II secretory pathway pseudopilin PulG